MQNALNEKLVVKLKAEEQKEKIEMLVVENAHLKEKV